MPKLRHNDRKCIGTGAALAPEAMAIRFVRGPEGELVPDLSEKLPGRGAWLSADRDALFTALKKGAFARAFKAPTHLPTETAEAFADQLSGLLLNRAVSRLGLARKAGEMILGADTVSRKSKDLVGYVHPDDAAPDGVRKVLARLEDRAKTNHISIPIDAEVLGHALGDLGIIHIGLLPGKLSTRALWELRRWQAFSGQKAANLH